MKLFRGFSVVALLAIVAVTVAACAPAQEHPVQSVEIGYVDWACATASSYLVKNIIEDKFDADVTLTSPEAGVMWEGVAAGDLDFMVCAWLPFTHASYWENYQDQVVDLGPNYHDAKIGLVVPQYVDIDSIEELNDHAAEFDNNIVGIDSGAGIMGAAANSLDDYDLDFSLQESSDATMTAELRTAIENEEWIVVTGWTPHWKFSDFDLKFLEDPKGSFGDAETINTITRHGFADDNPEINGFLDNYYLTNEQLAEVIGMMEEYNNNDDAAQAWIEANRSVVDSWLGK